MIKCPDQARTITLDLDPETTTIATVQALVADDIKAGWRALGVRVLRDSLPAARVMLTFGGRELGMEDTLAGYGIKDRSELEATVIRTDEEARLMRARTRKGEEMEKRRNQRRVVGKQTARMKAAGVANLPHQKTENEMEEEIAREAEEQFAEETRVLAADFAVMEDLRIEELEEQRLDEVRQTRQFQQRVDEPHEAVVDAPDENAFEEEDADKENWNPQILRSIGGERGAR